VLQANNIESQLQGVLEELKAARLEMHTTKVSS